MSQDASSPAIPPGSSNSSAAACNSAHWCRVRTSEIGFVGRASGLIEGINSLVQAAKAKARGYRSVRNLKAMVYLLAAKLNLMLPN